MEESPAFCTLQWGFWQVGIRRMEGLRYEVAPKTRVRLCGCHAATQVVDVTLAEERRYDREKGPGYDLEIVNV